MSTLVHAKTPSDRPNLGQTGPIAPQQPDPSKTSIGATSGTTDVCVGVVPRPQAPNHSAPEPAVPTRVVGPSAKRRHTASASVSRWRDTIPSVSSGNGARGGFHQAREAATHPPGSIFASRTGEILAPLGNAGRTNATAVILQRQTCSSDT